MWWQIFEDALEGKRGHYFEYCRTFKHGLEECGDRVDVFVSREAEPWLLQSLCARPMLPPSIWARMSDAAPRWRKLLRYPWHGWLTYSAWRRIFRDNSTPDVVFVPSVCTHHLFGIVPWLLLFARKMPCTFLLFFPSTPIRFDKERKAATLKPDLTAKFFPFLLRRLRKLVESGKVVLGVETRAMGDALASITGLPFAYFPHPVQAPRAKIDSPASDKALSAKRVVFGSYGFARFEKGSDLLQAAAKIVLNEPGYDQCHFALQWVSDFPDETGRTVCKDEYLRNNPRVRFIDDYFDPEGGYESQLSETDVMVLPYRESYRYRLSRVVIEAMIAGIPVVVSPCTTLAEQAVEHGEAIVLECMTPEALADAIAKAYSRIEQLKKQAQEKARSAAKHFSVAHFRELMQRRMPSPRGD
jgi:glycosyltransferase involved in cell wall biosynthesis